MIAFPRQARFLLLPLLALFSACNMVISETPMFAESDRGSALPRDGLWLSDDADCRFEVDQPESVWPECALWVVVRDSGRELHLNDGKGQAQRVVGLFAAGSPVIVQGEWFDEAKEPVRSYFSFFALEPRDVGADGRFTAAFVWPIECGVQERPNGDIRPFAGISPECRPSSKEAVRAAAAASRRAELIDQWRWLREEAR